MNKYITIIGALTIGVLLGLVAASVITTYLFPQSATVIEYEATFILEGTAWANNTAIDWGALFADTEYEYNFTVANTGSASFNVTMYVVNLPSGWTETWDANMTVLNPTEYIWGNLTLTVPAGATANTYNWDTTITLTEP